jgi:DNA primase
MLMLDGDESGRQATNRIAAQLASKCFVRRVTVPAGRQPDQLSSADIAALLAGNLDLEGATR